MHCLKAFKDVYSNLSWGYNNHCLAVEKYTRRAFGSIYPQDKKKIIASFQVMKTEKKLFFSITHLVVPGRDTVQTVILKQQMDGLTEKAKRQMLEKK